MRKKTYDLDEEKIERVRWLLHAQTDTEAIHRALQKTLEDHDLEHSLDRLLRDGRFRSVYR